MSTMPADAPPIQQQIAELRDEMRGEFRELRDGLAATLALLSVALAGPPKPPAPKARRRRTRATRAARPLTERQKEAVDLFDRFEGNRAEAARAMDVSRQAYNRHYEAAKAKLLTVPRSDSRRQSIAAAVRYREGRPSGDD